MLQHVAVCVAASCVVRWCVVVFGGQRKGTCPGVFAKVPLQCVLQRGAVCVAVCFAACCIVLWCVAVFGGQGGKKTCRGAFAKVEYYGVCCSVLQCVLQRVAVCVAACCSVLQCVLLCVLHSAVVCCSVWRPRKRHLPRRFRRDNAAVCVAVCAAACACVVMRGALCCGLLQ